MTISDRYGNELKPATEKPTVMQSVYAWYLLNELIELGYPHNFQGESLHIRNFCFDISSLIDKAHKIMEATDENA